MRERLWPIGSAPEHLSAGLRGSGGRLAKHKIVPDHTAPKVPPNRAVRALRMQDVLVPLGVAVLYVAAAKLGLALAYQAQQVTAVWPPTGLALAAVLRLRGRAVPGVLLGAFFANATAGEPLWVAAGIAVGNTLEALAAVALLSRAGFDGRLARLRDAVALLAAMAVAPVVSASIGVACLGAGGVQPVSSLRDLWSVWWLGDALGGLVFAPLLLVWSDKEPLPRRRGIAIEGALLLAGLLVASTFVFRQLSRAPAEYAVFPFLIWAALRFGPAGTVTASALVNAAAVWGTLMGFGPFAGAGPESGLVLLQIFMGVAATTGLLLGAVTAQDRRSTEAAQVSARRLVFALNAAHMGVWDWNIASGEVRWSGELEPLHGLPHGGFAGTYEAFRALIHPEDRERVEAAIRRSVETRVPYEEQFRILGADGVERWTDARGQVVEDASGRAVRMVGVGIDITRQKHLEEELRRQAEQLAEADRRKDEFLAMLAHELRNPLAPIVHAVELLGHPDPAQAKRGREIIRRQSEHLARLVDDLLDVSRITRGTVRLERRRVPLKEVVETAVDTWRHRIAERRQDLSIEIPEQTIWLDADPARLAQIVSNLLHNATNFTPERGRIGIEAGTEDGWAFLRVRDDGAGMTPEVIAQVFELFVQGAPPLDGQNAGLGLGLTLARRLAELHGGTLEGTSEGPGRGSEFVLRVPVAAPPVEVAPAPAVAAEPSGRAAGPARRVLVVDDNADAREALKFLLEDDGHVVRTAGDGPSALDEARSFRPDVILLDIGLPRLDGYEVARSLRVLPESARALVVAVSGYGQPEDRARSRAAGFDLHLLKPVEPRRLLELLRTLPAEHRSPSGASGRPRSGEEIGLPGTPVSRR